MHFARTRRSDICLHASFFNAVIVIVSSYGVISPFRYSLGQTQAVLMFVKSEGYLEDIKTAVFHHPAKAKHLNFSTYIYFFIINQVSVF